MHSRSCNCCRARQSSAARLRGQGHIFPTRPSLPSTVRLHCQSAGYTSGSSASAVPYQTSSDTSEHPPLRSSTLWGKVSHDQDCHTRIYKRMFCQRGKARGRERAQFLCYNAGRQCVSQRIFDAILMTCDVQQLAIIHWRVLTQEPPDGRVGYPNLLAC